MKYHRGFGVWGVSGVVAGWLVIVSARAETILTLEESIEIALKQNQGLAVAREKVKEAETGMAEARARFWPQFSTRATYTRLDVAPYIPLGKLPLPGVGGGGPAKIEIGDDDNYALVLSAQQPLYTGGKLRNGYRAAEEGVSAEDFRLRQAEAELVLQVEQAYFGLLKVRQIEQVAQQAVAQMEAHVRDVENLYQAGMAAQHDLLKARVQLSNVQVMQLQATNGVQLARVVLCNLLGLPLDTEVVPATRLEEGPGGEVPLSEAIQQGLAKRPELAALEHAAKAAEWGVEIARGQRWPDILLVGNYNLKRPNRENEPEFYRSWDATLAVQWAVFDGGLRTAQVDRARAQLAQLRRTAAQVRDGIVLEITQAYLKLTEAQKRTAATAANVAQAEENFRVTNEKFSQGLATSTDLLDAQTMLTQAKVDYATALADYQIDRAALGKAMGVRRGKSDEPGY